MELLHKLEKTVLGWLKSVPHLPVSVQKWLATNAWWIVLIGVILGAIGLLVRLSGLFVAASLIGSVANPYLLYGGVTAWTIVVGAIGLAFSALTLVINAFAIQPLKAMQKKGWVLLFLSLLVTAASVVITAILKFNILTLFVELIFSAIFIALAAYILFEIHSYFTHDKKVAAKPAKKA